MNESELTQSRRAFQAEFSKARTALDEIHFQILRYAVQGDFDKVFVEWEKLQNQLQSVLVSIYHVKRAKEAEAEGGPGTDSYFSLRD